MKWSLAVLPPRIFYYITRICSRLSRNPSEEFWGRKEVCSINCLADKYGWSRPLSSQWIHLLLSTYQLFSLTVIDAVVILFFGFYFSKLCFFVCFKNILVLASLSSMGLLFESFWSFSSEVFATPVQTLLALKVQNKLPTIADENCNHLNICKKEGVPKKNY